MRPLDIIEGKVSVLDRADVDTDQIIPKQFLKQVEKAGFGLFAFFDWRYDADGRPNPDFELNRPEYKGASILVAGRNFGSGSSREHAAWALKDFGFRTIIAVIGGAEQASVALHNSCGFEEMGRLKGAGFKFGRWLDSVYMQRGLAGKGTGVG